MDTEMENGQEYGKIETEKLTWKTKMAGKMEMEMEDGSRFGDGMEK